MQRNVTPARLPLFPEHRGRGHSAGAGGALMVAGALRNFTGTPVDLADPAHRPVAHLAFSLQQPGSEGFFDTDYQQQYNEVAHPLRARLRPVALAFLDAYLRPNASAFPRQWLGRNMD